MDDLKISVEHMDRFYLWRIRKRGHRVHTENPETGRAYCQAENCGGLKPFDGRGEEAPSGRRLCKNCTDLANRNKTDYREPNIKVLLGEQMELRPTAEPDLFVSDTVSKPWSRKKQARAVHQPKVKKTKRSKAKYHRPFNDDLPW